MTDESVDKIIEIDTEEFFHDLHYDLGAGEWNLGDGHTWRIDAEKLRPAWARILSNFVMALQELFKEFEDG